MANVRRRKQGKDEADTLTESLLDHEDDADEQHPARPNRSTAIIVYPGEFNLQRFVQSILDWWNGIFGTLLTFATSCWPQLRDKPLSLLQLEQLQQLRERTQEKFDLSDPAHQEALRRLWGLAFAGEACTQLKTARWKDMGWQGEDPATDFRGAGLYGLENLIYLGEAHPDTFRRLLDKSEGARATWEYPFAVAGLNLTFALSELLELHTNTGAACDGPPKRAAARAFASLLGPDGGAGAGGQSAFEELYCATFCLLDATWLEMKASYMDFNTVLKRVKAEVEDALESRPPDMRALRTRMLGAARAAELE
ncbi:hypothetical protein HYH03_016710 [Edaphochlamys debaryana]|uniref:ELMO domain-containing protein n=1 Tax=Edaphochlamys debaryana TaxID=47281 RepID=A0A835XLK1_9CHLO|nr:hypothetical protein HYH03_016710 [Edaphochlamys debaryana]|eukprot:KAG2484476.1 hypothetical protein HYH03_016710 [Edaphochlamys debaryana]